MVLFRSTKIIHPPFVAIDVKYRYLPSEAELVYFRSGWYFVAFVISLFQPASRMKPLLSCLVACGSSSFASCIRCDTINNIGYILIITVASSMPHPASHGYPHQAPNKRRFVRGEILRGVFHIKAAKNKKHSEFTMVGGERRGRW